MLIMRVLSVCVLLAIVACSTTTKESAEETVSEAKPVVAEEESELDPELGAKIYSQYCFVCHMNDGNGVPGLNPPLVNSPWVQGDKTQLISIVLKGSQGGQYEMNGEKFTNMMIAHNFLTDDEIAAVLTYVRSNFENNADAVTNKEVAEVRKSLE